VCGPSWGIIKCQFGFVEVRYRGLKNNIAEIYTMSTLSLGANSATAGKMAF